MSSSCHFFFFFNDTATTEIYTLSLHDALPIYPGAEVGEKQREAHHNEKRGPGTACHVDVRGIHVWEGLRGRPDELRRIRSEEHTSELQSLAYLVCRLLLEKKKRGTHSRPH